MNTIIKASSIEGEFTDDDPIYTNTKYRSKTEYVYSQCTLDELFKLKVIALVEAPQEVKIIQEYIKKFYPGVDF